MISSQAYLADDNDARSGKNPMMATPPAKYPQNREVTVAVLAALDDNVGKYFTVEDENKFLARLSATHNFVWEGKGHWNDKHHSWETLRRVLNRLAQDRRLEFRDLPGDDKVHDRIHALFRIGSALIKPERLRDYGYVRDMRPDADGRPKRSVAQLMQEFREAQREHQTMKKEREAEDGYSPMTSPAAVRTRASMGSSSRGPPPRKKIRTHFGGRKARRVDSDGAVASSSRQDGSRPRRWKTANLTQRWENGRSAAADVSSPRRGGSRYVVHDSDEDEGSSEYEDAIQYEGDYESDHERKIKSQQNGHRGEFARERLADKRRYEEVDDEDVISRPLSQKGRFGQRSSSQGPVLMTELLRLHKTIEKLADTFFPLAHVDSQPAVLAHNGSDLLKTLYSLAFGNPPSWQLTAGALLEIGALSARSFALALIWSFLRQNLLEKSFPETPLWSLLDSENVSHQFLRADMESGISAGVSKEQDEAEGKSTGFMLMRQFLRRVAFRQLQGDQDFRDKFLQPVAWEQAFVLRDLLHAHAPQVDFRDPQSSLNHNHKRGTTNGMHGKRHTSVDAQILLLCKEACTLALTLRGRAQIGTEKFEWIWVASGAEFDSRRMVDASARRAGSGVGKVVVGVMPGLRWLPPEGEEEPYDEDREEDEDVQDAHNGIGPREWRVVRASVGLMPNEGNNFE